MNKEQVLKIGEQLARKKGLINVSRQDICLELGIPEGSWATGVGIPFLELVRELKLRLGDEKLVKMSKKRAADPELRKDHILDVALKLAETNGYSRMTVVQVAEAAGITHGTVLRYFGTVAQLRNDVMRKAVKTNNLKIIAQGLSAGDRQAQKADEAVKAEALNCLMVRG